MLRINGGDYQVVAWNGTNYEASAAVPASDLNTWVQLVGVYDGTDWLLYRDGALVASAPARSADSARWPRTGPVSSGARVGSLF